MANSEVLKRRVIHDSFQNSTNMADKAATLIAKLDAFDDTLKKALCVGKDKYVNEFTILLLFVLVHVKLRSNCDGARDSCHADCRASIKINGQETALVGTGRIFNIVSVELATGKIGYYRISNYTHIPRVMIENARNFMTDVPDNSVLIILLQGCGMVPEALKNVFKKEIPIIGNFQDFNRIHAVISCKGDCPIKKYHYFNDETSYKKTITFPLKGM